MRWYETLHILQLTRCTTVLHLILLASQLQLAKVDDCPTLHLQHGMATEGNGQQLPAVERLVMETNNSPQ
jgi:hypothetical protein